ncbi:MAG: pyruvate kinase [Pirellulaceae bacterium]
MNDQETPRVKRIKRTKIVATIGPASSDRKQIAQLVSAGVDVFRLNMAHGDLDQHDAVLENIRDVSAEAGRPIGVLADLSGPKIRLGTLVEDPTVCEIDDEFRFLRGTESSAPTDLTCNYAPLVDELSVGDQVMLADGTVHMQVVEKNGDSVTCKVVGPGEIRSRQGINLPGVKLSVPSLTEDDRRHAAWAAQKKIDFVGLSFVRSHKDVRELKDLLRSLGTTAMVVAKIEKAEALVELDDVIFEADAVMVARGDLGVETDVAETPLVQKRIVAACARLCKPVIIATQMLSSMEHSRRPTRAEVTDVANAIIDGADACMLSGETAIGDYPLETVKMMSRIIRATERELHDTPPKPPASGGAAGVHPITSAVVYGAGRIAAQLHARLTVVATHSGGTARVKAKQRDFIPTIGLSDSTSVLRQMCLLWGVTPLANAPMGDPPALRQFVVEWGRKQKQLTEGDLVVFVTGTGLVRAAHNLIVVHEVE